MLTYLFYSFSLDPDYAGHQSNIRNLNNSVAVARIVCVAIKLLTIWEC